MHSSLQRSVVILLVLFRERIFKVDEFAEDSSGSGRCGFLLRLVREVRRRGFSGRCRLLVFVGDLFRPLRSIVSIV